VLGAVAATPGTASASSPTAPTLTYVHGGPATGQMTFKWSPPRSNGGKAITSYTYEYAVDGGVWIQGATSFAGTARTAIVPCPAPQSPGHGCSFQIRANNGVPGAWSAKKSALWAKPGAPGLPSANAGPAVGQARLQFTPPKTNGGLLVTSYQYAVYAGVSWSAPITIAPSAITTVATSPLVYRTVVPCSITTTGGPTGCKYRMYAVNAVSAGIASAPMVAQLTMPAGVQQLKAITTSVDLGTGSSTQTVSWNAPNSTGGLTITHTTLFACTTSQGSLCKDYSPSSDWTTVADYPGNPSSVTTTGVCVENGRCGYEVKAFNALGASFVVAFSSPAPPRSLAATPSTAVAGQVDLSWIGTIDNGGSFGNYVLLECSVINDCNTGTWTTNPSPWTATSLTGNGTTGNFACGISTSCEFRVGYVNANGDIGGVTNAVTAVGLDAPQVTATATGAPGTIDVNWTPPSTTATITSYKIERDTGSGFTQLAIVGPTPTAYTDSTCPPGTSCGYRVTAFYTIGTSAVSTPAYATAAS
jgi:hypothetical protein